MKLSLQRALQLKDMRRCETFTQYYGTLSYVRVLELNTKYGQQLVIII